MKRGFIVIAVVGALGVTAAVMAASKVKAGAVAQAVQASEPDRPIANLIRSGVRRLITLNQDLNITDQQRSKIRNVVKGHREEIKPVAKDVMAKRQALREAVLADSPSEETIRAAADALGESIGDAAVLASKVAAEVKPILTEEQTQLLREFRADRQLTIESFIDGMSED